jgi:P27 family predicted phage terminase small subunit
MGKRGPKPKTNIKVLKPIIPKRLRPPKGLSSKARHVWKTVVNAYPVGHFRPQHRELLRMYCTACVLQKKADHEVEVSGEIIEQKNGVIKENPYINIAFKAQASATALATKLGITVNNTTVNRGIKGSVSKPKSKRAGLLGGLNEN